MTEDSHDLADDTVTLLGPRVRRLREAANMTLEQLADAAGVSRAMLSKIERGEKSPTLTIVSRIAKGFNITLSHLLGESAGESSTTMSIVRRSQRLVFTDAENGFERHVLIPDYAGNGLELIMHVIPSHTNIGRFLPYNYRASKHIVVQEGVLTATVNNKLVELAAGDALYFEIQTAYELANRADARCVYYMFIARSSR